jgi:hypothetical protein
VKWGKISGKAGVKILTKSLKFGAQLADLEKILNLLQFALERGDWDKISDFSGQLLPALEAVSTPDYLAQNTSQYSEKIRHTLTLLQAAIVLCSERKEQISPLINALTPAKATPKNP